MCVYVCVYVRVCVCVCRIVYKWHVRVHICISRVDVGFTYTIKYFVSWMHDDLLISTFVGLPQLAVIMLDTVKYAQCIFCTQAYTVHTHTHTTHVHIH